MTAAYEFSNQGVATTLIEQDCSVGGLARTIEHNGYRFDIGGHRFFTKLPLIEKIWTDILGEDLLVRPRLSRIYYRGKFFQYPLEIRNVIQHLGPIESARCVASFVRARMLPSHPETDFETWIANRFGRRLFDTFFKSYTEKVWGMSCKEIGSEWGQQRIRGLSLTSLLRDAVAAGRERDVPRSLIREFYYPRLGPGMMWSRMRDLLEARGSQVHLNRPVAEIHWEPGRVLSVVAGGEKFRGTHFLSSVAIRDLIASLRPAPPPQVRRALEMFRYRDFITVAIMVRGDDVFPDNWIYIHDPSVAVGRIQNFRNWSAEMIPDPGMTCLGLEYFCHEGDGLWSKSDAELIEQAKREVGQLALLGKRPIVDAVVVRVKKAYPVYDQNYAHGLRIVRSFLKMLPNLQLIGRNGMHRYNNQDHSMLTGILAARNALGAKYDLWGTSIDSGYIEDFSTRAEELNTIESTQPSVAVRAASA